MKRKTRRMPRNRRRNKLKSSKKKLETKHAKQNASLLKNILSLLLQSNQMVVTTTIAQTLLQSTTDLTKLRLKESFI